MSSSPGMRYVFHSFYCLALFWHQTFSSRVFTVTLHV
jgi:hypothetical protein